jgi:toxin ParE1/3/4
MGNVYKHPLVIHDLIDLATYIAFDNIDVSDKFLAAAEETFKQLAQTPKMGRLREALTWRYENYGQFTVT